MANIPVRFESETEEAEWWANNQDFIAELFEKAAAEGKLGRGTVAELARIVHELRVKRDSQKKLEGLLLDGLESGPPSEMTPQDWVDLRAEAVKQLQARRKAAAT